MWLTCNCGLIFGAVSVDLEVSGLHNVGIMLTNFSSNLLPNFSI